MLFQIKPVSFQNKIPLACNPLVSWNPRKGRHLVWYHGALFWIFRDSHFVAAIFLSIHAKFGDSSFNRLGAMALGVKKIRTGFVGSVDGALGAHFGLHHWIPLIFSSLDAKTEKV